MLKNQTSSSCYLERKTGNIFYRIRETGSSFENFPAFLPNVKTRVCHKWSSSCHPILHSFSPFDRRWNRLYNIIHFVNLNSLKLFSESQVPQIHIRTIHSKPKQVKCFLETTWNSVARYAASKEAGASLGYFSGLNPGNHSTLHVKNFILQIDIDIDID